MAIEIKTTSGFVLEDDTIVRCFMSLLSNPNITEPFEEIADLAEQAARTILKRVDIFAVLGKALRENADIEGDEEEEEEEEEEED